MGIITSRETVKCRFFEAGRINDVLFDKKRKYSFLRPIDNNINKGNEIAKATGLYYTCMKLALQSCMQAI